MGNDKIFRIFDEPVEMPSDLIDVDEVGQQALREKINTRQGVKRKPLNQEQGTGDYVSG